jgi:hypothetical protein
MALSSISAWLDQLTTPGPKFQIAETPKFEHPPFHIRPPAPKPIITVTEYDL